MREIRTYGSEGGEGRKPFPTPITSLARGDAEIAEKRAILRVLRASA